MIHIPIDRESPVSLARQMVLFLREAILSGALAPGEKLPSTRALSRELNVARNVAIECMEQLAAEGYIELLRGSGAYVAEGVQFEPAAAREAPRADDGGGLNRDIIRFRTGVPDPSPSRGGAGCTAKSRRRLRRKSLTTSARSARRRSSVRFQNTCAGCAASMPNRKTF
jgi:DNA-binding transcriptional MocR family regulator